MPFEDGLIYLTDFPARKCIYYKLPMEREAPSELEMMKRIN